MIDSKQYQPQLPIFSKLIIADKKVDLSHSVLGTSGFRERHQYKRQIGKRASCHNMTTENRQNQSDQLSNKLLDHIFNQIKQNNKPSQRPVNQTTIIHAMVQRENPKTNSQSKQLNQDSNLKIKSIHNLIQPKSRSTHRNHKSGAPFQNKKLMNLRKGKSYSLYTQEIEPQITEQSNDGKILPWEMYNNHIIDLPGVAPEIDDETAEQNYLKSQNLKTKDSKTLAKYNTLAFSPPEERKTSFKKYSSIDVTQAEKHKPYGTKYNQIFSAHHIKQQTGRCQRTRCRHGNINRTLTEMRMDIEDIQMGRPQNGNSKVKLDDFFDCIITKEIFSKRPSVNQSHRHAQSLPRQSNQGIINCLLKVRRI